jgi:peptide-methionine (S)-S-oxide reductase
VGTLPEVHLTLGTDIRGPWPQGTQVLYFGMGCFWGAEKKLWVLPGVVSTAVGYMGGTATDPTYPLVCTGTTGHSEIVLVAYDPTQISEYELLKCFWENHDPTQGNRQGNDVGSQYRSAVYWTTPEQENWVRQSRDAYNSLLESKGFDSITTELAAASQFKFWYAEEYHQQYLIKNPKGYDCHAHTGILLPEMTALSN